MSSKHIVTALLVAPVLALLAWFITGKFSAEQPHAARGGEAYPLVEKSNCRRSGGTCDLVNEQFRVTLSATSDNKTLVLSASHPLEGVLVEIGTDSEAPSPEPMAQVDNSAMQWRLSLAFKPSSQQAIRLAAVANGAQYFAETTAVFLN
ncbi:MAG: hypothetical protein AAF699_14755 [Pseudomonadota bacterium]